MQIGWKAFCTVIVGLYGLILTVGTIAVNSPEMTMQQKREDSLAHIEQLRNDSVETNKKQKEIAQKKQKEIEEANKIELAKEPRLINSIGELKQRFNDFAAAGNDLNFRINDIKIEQGEVNNTFKYYFNDNIGWIGALNKSDNSVKELTMICTGDGTYTGVGNIMIMMLGVIATIDPAIKPTDRGDILKRLGFFDKSKKVSDMDAHVVQNGIKYYISSSPQKEGVI
jgi:hypothetical protein